MAGAVAERAAEYRQRIKKSRLEVCSGPRHNRHTVKLIAPNGEVMWDVTAYGQAQLAEAIRAAQKFKEERGQP